MFVHVSFIVLLKNPILEKINLFVNKWQNSFTIFQNGFQQVVFQFFLNQSSFRQLFQNHALSKNEFKFISNDYSVKKPFQKYVKNGFNLIENCSTSNDEQS